MSAQPSRALGWLPFAGLPLTAYDYFIERVPSSNAARLYEWKDLRREGYDVVVLLAPDEKTLVGLGLRYG
jgi:hypothetical protein